MKEKREKWNRKDIFAYHLTARSSGGLAITSHSMRMSLDSLTVTFDGDTVTTGGSRKKKRKMKTCEKLDYHSSYILFKEIKP